MSGSTTRTLLLPAGGNDYYYFNKASGLDDFKPHETDFSTPYQASHFPYLCIGPRPRPHFPSKVDCHLRS